MPNVKVDYRGLNYCIKSHVKAKQVDQFIIELIKELAARLLAKVKRRTPVGVYPKGAGKMGGTLRRGWTIGGVRKTNGGYEISVINPVLYASYVEFGHRTRGGNGWVMGQFMLTISENELNDELAYMIQNKLDQFLKGAI